MAAVSASHCLVYSLFASMMILLAFLFSTAATAEAPTTAAGRHGYAMQLIHRDSVFSPYYKPHATIPDRMARDLRSAMARLAFLEGRAAGILPASARSGVIAAQNGVQFLVNFSVGQPPVQQLADMDTGSALLWIQCLPCYKCFKQRSPIFDPSKSLTYRNLPCDSSQCTYPTRSGKCDSSHNCKFAMRYLDGSGAEGLFATETITFETPKRGKSTISDMVIGCGHDNTVVVSEQSGVMGLAPDFGSLVTKTEFRLSYCIGSVKDPLYTHNLLILGSAAVLQGDSTPLDLFRKLYFLTMESISVGQKRLNIDPGVFRRRPGGRGGVIIDSGTSFTYLTPSAFDPLSDAVQELLNGFFERVKHPDMPSLLCYQGDMNHLKGFPVVTLGFAAGAELGLGVDSMFMSNGPGEFCMAVLPSKAGTDGLNIIGVMAQQYYNIGYDLVGKKAFFQSIDCALLE